LSANSGLSIRYPFRISFTSMWPTSIPESTEIYPQLPRNYYEWGKRQIHTWIGNLPQRKDFPKDNSVRPHVGLAGKDAINQGFNRHPLDRHQSLTFKILFYGNVDVVFLFSDYLFSFFVIFFVIHFLRHSKVGHFCNSIVSEQNVAGGQITMENLSVIMRVISSNIYVFTRKTYLFANQVVHSSSYLKRPRNEICCWNRPIKISIRIL
jgi:hypothetical protein